MIGMILTAFAVGFVVAIPPGAVTIFASNLAVKDKLSKAFIFISGAFIADIFYLLIIYFGINSSFIDQNKLLKFISLILIGLILIFLGIDAIKIKIDTKKEKKKNELIKLKIFSTGILVTLLNPITIAGWFGVAGGYFTAWHSNWPPVKYYGLLSILVIMTGVSAWIFPLLTILNKTKHYISPKIIRIFSFISGMFLIILAFNSFWTALKIFITF